jgi:hypothetical protein
VETPAAAAVVSPTETTAAVTTDSSDVAKPAAAITASESATPAEDRAEPAVAENRAVVEPGVVKKGVTKKAMPGPITVKSVAPKKKTVANKKGSGSDGRRGIRLKSDVEDTEL